MDDKVFVKPTDYVILDNGELGYSFNYDEQFKDAKKLNELSKTDLLQEVDDRWKNVQELPVPSRVSKYTLAKDLAYAKGYAVDTSRQNILSTSEKQREF